MNGQEVYTLEITNKADREAVALVLYRHGYTVRERRRRDGKKLLSFWSIGGADKC